MQTKLGYKIFDCIDEQPYFIFHALCRKTRGVPLGIWLIAEKKLSRDSMKPFYITGFHVFPTLNDLTRAICHFRRLENRVVVRVRYGGIFPKPTKSTAVLADMMRISKWAWQNRKPLKKFKR